MHANADITKTRTINKKTMQVDAYPVRKPHGLSAMQ